MDDGWGSLLRSRPQSPGHDIGPGEDGLGYSAQGTPIPVVSYVYTPQDHMDTQLMYINHINRQGLIYETMDETPRSLWAIDELYHEINRLKSFEGNWRISYSVHADDLAKHGFFYTGPGDRVKCVFCLKTLWNWEPNDSVESEHKKHYPDCPFVRGKCENLNVPLSQVQNMKRTMGLHLKVQTSEQNVLEPSNYSDRLKTYQNWPKNAPVRADALANAGFFCLGIEDQVKCFSCEQVLKSWQPGDDPWFEHAKVSQSCPYIQTVKGTDYLQQVHNLLVSPESKSYCSSKEMSINNENKSVISHLKEGEQPVCKPQEVKPLLLIQEQRSQIDDDLNNTAVQAMLYVHNFSIEQMRKQLEQIRITKGSNHKVTTQDFQDLSDMFREYYSTSC